MRSWVFIVIGCLASSAVGLDIHDALNVLGAENVWEGISNSSASEACKRDMIEYLDTLTDLENLSGSLWALQMLDSSAKIPSAILTGTYFHFGQFDECLAVRHPAGSFQGQHCMIKTNLTLSGAAKVRKGFVAFQNIKGRVQAVAADLGAESLLLSIGFCFPSTCPADDLNAIFNFNPKFAGILTAEEQNCWTSDPRTLSTASWAFVSVIIFIVVLIALSSAYEIRHLIKNESPNKLLISFSIYSNMKSMIEIRDSSGEMACLHGMRALSMMWVVLGHTYEGMMTGPVTNNLDLLDNLNSPNKIPVVNGFASVDTFFFLSGLLVAFVFFRNIGRKGSFDAPTAYIHRYLRLTPSFLFMAFFSMSLLPDLDKGPLWSDYTNAEVRECSQNWWSNVIYLQNYISPLHRCLGQSWYLNVDMQLFWLSPIVLYPLYFWPTYGIIFLATLTVLSTLWTFGIAYDYGFMAAMTPLASDVQFSIDYVATHTRMQPWLVGVGLGFAICAIKARRINVRLSKMWVVLGWISSTGICLGCLYGFNSFQGDHPAGPLNAAFFLAFTRPAWGIGLSWIVFACVYGYGGVVNSILSMGIFQPLGKLSYNVYLLHITLLIYRVGVMRNYFYVSDFNMIYEYLATLVLSYILAAGMYLLVEAPFGVIDRELLKNVEIFPYPKPKTEAKAEDPQEERNNHQVAENEKLS